MPETNALATWLQLTRGRPAWQVAAVLALAQVFMSCLDANRDMQEGP